MNKTTNLAALIMATAVLTWACSPEDDHHGSMNGDTEHEEMDHDEMDGHQETDRHEDEGQHDDHGDVHGDSSDHHDDGEGHDASPPENVNEYALEGLMVENTKNVTRISEDDPVLFSVKASQTIWPATHEDNQPGTVILAPLDEWQYALASLTLVHHPNDGPLLYFDGALTDEVVAEMERLQPKGNSEGIEVMVMGELNEVDQNKLEGFEVEHLTADDPAAFAAIIDEHYAELSFIEQSLKFYYCKLTGSEAASTLF
ncbi:hypothetical protein CR205_10570 [Alteribacter lacisalsi]|uniref:Uncharacterized protein n=1 Tax=Alteribacter lacisalsi TaxID=2045244 RepID=A0A2W0HPF6_9BACI|nr:hypothetical protein [Alteribacter lacisalsi]PYZ98982.1 hypothetical protein CR205_10570 [Alteribacter lacisalsi]